MKYLIAGLGNIGEEYANTRHNIGFIVLDALAAALDAKFTIDRHAFKAEAKFKGRTLILIKPTTYMNLSGKAVKYWLDKEKIPLENSLVISDDLDLPLGVLRLKVRGSGGSHNGLNHIIETLLTNEFPRLRIGIGDDFARGYQAEYVLSRWSKTEEKILIPRIEMAVEAIKSFVTVGIDRTMNDFNKK